MREAPGTFEEASPTLLEFGHIWWAMSDGHTVAVEAWIPHADKMIHLTQCDQIVCYSSWNDSLFMICRSIHVQFTGTYYMECLPFHEMTNYAEGLRHIQIKSSTSIWRHFQGHTSDEKGEGRHRYFRIQICIQQIPIVSRYKIPGLVGNFGSLEWFLFPLSNR